MLRRVNFHIMSVNRHPSTVNYYFSKFAQNPSPMYIQQLYTGCLSEAAYYIEDKGEAAIIDPLRDIEEYLLIAKERNAVIKYIFETHFHADFVSGHLDLAQAS